MQLRCWELQASCGASIIWGAVKRLASRQGSDPGPLVSYSLTRGLLAASAGLGVPIMQYFFLYPPFWVCGAVGMRVGCGPWGVASGILSLHRAAASSLLAVDAADAIFTFQG